MTEAQELNPQHTDEWSTWRYQPVAREYPDTDFPVVSLEIPPAGLHNV
jgi:hypothetical protein